MHSQTAIVEKPHVTLFLGVRKAGPAAMRFELCVGGKQLRAAGTAMKRPGSALVQKTAAEGSFRTGFTQDVVPFRTEFGLPLLFALAYFGGYVVSHHTLRTLGAGARMHRGSKKAGTHRERWQLCA